MEKDITVDAAAEGWFPDGIEILPRPPIVVMAAAFAALIAAIANMNRLAHLHARTVAR